MLFIDNRNNSCAHLVAIVALAVSCGCSTDASNRSNSDAGSLTCGNPSCCVPIVVDPSRVHLYRSSDGVRVGMVLDFGAQPLDWWDINVDVVLVAGTSVSCEAGPSPPASDYKTVTILCPTVALDATPACDSTVVLELRPRSSTYPDSSRAQTLCAGADGRSIKLTVPVTCPDSCGSPSNGTSCTVLGQTCNYSAMAYGGAGGTSTVSLPCSCGWNEILNGLAWSCAVP